MKHTIGLWAGMIVLAVAMFGAGWYFNSGQQQVKMDLAKVPSLQSAFDGAKVRLDASEANLRQMTDRYTTINTRLDQMEHRVNASVAGARNQVQKAMGEMETRLEAKLNNQIDERTSMLKTQLDEVQNAQRLQHARLDQVEHQLSDSQRQVADVRDGQAASETALHAENGQQARRLDAIERAHEKTRIDFELSRSQTTDLLPGVMLTLQSTDPSRQKYNGYLFLMQDRRTIWIKGQGAQSPVTFYPKAGGQPLRLVVNQVTKRDVVGYLSMPISQSEFGQAADAGGSR